MKPSKNDVIDLRTSRATSLETSSCTDAKVPDLTPLYAMADNGDAPTAAPNAAPAPAVVIVNEQRKRRSKQEKQALVKLTYLPGNTVSSVARQNGVTPAMLFKGWAQDKAGLLSTNTNVGQKVSPAAKYAEALDEIKRLQRLLGKTTSENELLKEAVEIMSSKKWIAR